MEKLIAQRGSRILCDKDDATAVFFSSIYTFLRTIQGVLILIGKKELMIVFAERNENLHFKHHHTFISKLKGLSSKIINL